MSCYGCRRTYGLFCKEYGCPNCGYSYCAKCLKRPMAVQRHNNKILNVCLICYDTLSKMQAHADAEKVIDCDALPGELVTKLRLPPKHTDIDVADALFDNVPPSEELAAVLAPTRIAENGDAASAAVVAEVTVQVQATSAQDIDVNLESAIRRYLQNLKAATGEAPTTSAQALTTSAQDIDENLDITIKKRLENLKAVETSDDEIRERLSNLSGMPHQKNYDKKDLLLNTDQRSDEDRIKEILHQFLGETQLDQRVDDDRNNSLTDIERRLRALRDTPIDGSGLGASSIGVAAEASSTATNTPSDNEEENDETLLQNVIKKYLLESRLPEEANPLEAELGIAASSSINEELPWCNICDEDAVFRCLGCDGELFCATCYRECHDDEEHRAHVKEKYSVPPKFKENHF